MFYIENGKEQIRPIALATCILYENNNNYYLITASHVFEDIETKTIGILINDVFSSLHGKLIYTNNKENKIDLAIMKLYDHFVQNIIGEYTFLQNDNIDRNHILTNRIEYLMAGFPTSKTKIKDYNKTIKREQFVFLTQCANKENYEQLNYNANNHIMVDVKNTRDFENVTIDTTIPNLFGVSGSGLWHLPSPSYSSYKLTAIMTDWDKKNNLAIGTRIDIVIEIIKHHLDEK